MADPVTLVRVTHGEVTEQGDNWKVDRFKTMSDGSVEEGCHIISKECLEWRAAEYGIPQQDLNTLLDIVLAEPYMTDEDWATGPNLHTASSVAEARDAHLARVIAVKLRLRISTQSKDPNKVYAVIKAKKPGAKDEVITFLDIIRAGSPIEDETLDAKREMVKSSRRSVREENNKAKPTRRERFRREVEKRKE
jgi:hypothetical protein